MLQTCTKPLRLYVFIKRLSNEAEVFVAYITKQMTSCVQDLVEAVGSHIDVSIIQSQKKGYSKAW